MNDRLESLFKRYEIEPRFIHANDFSVLDKPYAAKSATNITVNKELI